MTETTDELRYPIGRLVLPPAPTDADLQAYRTVLAGFPDRLRALVAGFDTALWDTPYREGGWTCRQLVHHLADSHTQAVIRVKWTLTEETPLLKVYRQDGFANLPDSRTADPVDALDLLAALHRRWVALFDNLTAEQLARTYVHPERSTTPENLRQLHAQYAWHSRHHYMHIYRLLERQRNLPSGVAAW